MSTVFEIETTNKTSISITKYASKINNKKAIIISSATGVLQNYYRPFSEYLSTLGFTVFTFDYSGIGRSLEGSIKACKADLSHWAKDQEAVIAYTKTEYTDYKIILIAHSIGGPLIGLNNKSIDIDRLITVASQTIYWKYFKGFDRFKILVFWRVLVPILSPLFGYFPSKKLGLFENLPKRVIYQFKNWSKQPNYFLSEFNNEDLFFEKLTCPVLILSFSKDEFAPKPAVDWFAKLFTNSKVERQHIVTDPHAGHFGFFQKTFKTPLWELAGHWINT